MKITSDKPAGKVAQTSRYHEAFSKLTPEKNCIVCDDMKEMGRVSQALEGWAKKNIGKDVKVVTTKRYPSDGKPRCWLIWTEAPKTTIRGNFPKAA